MTERSSLHRFVRAVRDLGSCSRTPPLDAGFELALAERVDFLDGAAWDGVTRASSLFLGRAFLRTLEAHPPTTHASFVRALLYREGEPVAALAAQTVELSLSALAAPGSKRARAARVLPIDERVLVCGNLLSCGQHGVAFAPGTEVQGAWPGVAHALERMRRMDDQAGDASLVVVKDAPRAKFAGAASLAASAYRAVETEPDMVLDLRKGWRTFDDYLASLASSYRKAARGIAKDVDAAGAAVERVHDVEREAARLHALYLQVHERQKMRVAALDPRFLPALAEALGDDLRVIGVRRAGVLEGFACCVRDGDTAIGWFLGYDGAAAAEYPVYLRLLHALVAEAIDLRCARLSLGRTALEPKARLGARPEALSVWVKHRIPALNVALRGLAHVVTHDEPPVRSPFKD